MDNLQIYDEWNSIKKFLQQRNNVEFFKERQIWWCNVGQNLGMEIFGKGDAFSRPVLVYKKLSGNLFVGIPFTSQKKHGTWYQTIRHRGKDTTAILNQVKVFDKKRLINCVGEIDDEDFRKIKTGFDNLFK